MTTPRLGLLFHFTHLDNVPAILEQEALLSDTTVAQLGLLANEAGDTAIKERRRMKVVTCPPGGVVADYVPFYFAARSPMMYVLWQGRVPTFSGDHNDLVYFVTSADKLQAGNATFAISNRNAAAALADFTNDPAALGDLTTAAPDSSFIDWPLMNERIWKDTAEDGDRMQRRMAEFLVHERVPLDVLLGLAVPSHPRSTVVRSLLDAQGIDLPVHARPGWYYP